MTKQKKTPQSATSRSDKKNVRTQDIQQLPYPSWRFSTVDKDGPFAWPIDTPLENEILQKLRGFDSMRWEEIEGSDHHAISIERLSKKAKDRLVHLRKDDLEQIFSFHYTGKKRIIGIREFNLIKLLWWDPEHEVCPSIKKHT